MYRNVKMVMIILSIKKYYLYRNISASVLFLTERIPESKAMSIRVQSFSSPVEDAIKSYKDELIRQCGTPSQQQNWTSMIKETDIDDSKSAAVTESPISTVPEKKAVRQVLLIYF